MRWIMRNRWLLESAILIACSILALSCSAAFPLEHGIGVLRVFGCAATWLAGVAALATVSAIRVALDDNRKTRTAYQYAIDIGSRTLFWGLGLTLIVFMAMGVDFSKHRP